MNLDAQIEAILFFKGEPVSIVRLSDLLQKTKEEIVGALKTLEANLKDRGVTLITKENEVMLGTSPALSSIIENITREELTREIGKAGLETLSIILYKGPLSRREIDYIRGVNSNFILRNLLIRGLVEKITSPTDQRSFLYKPTFELLSFMGLKRIEDLPEYSAIRQEIEEAEKISEEADEQEEKTVEKEE
jgi:segregation and condensation protein B